jgi:hypothetical protein
MADVQRCEHELRTQPSMTSVRGVAAGCDLLLRALRDSRADVESAEQKAADYAEEIDAAHAERDALRAENDALRHMLAKTGATLAAVLNSSDAWFGAWECGCTDTERSPGGIPELCPEHGARLVSDNNGRTKVQLNHAGISGYGFHRAALAAPTGQEESDG